MKFVRTVSGASTEPPETLLEHDDDEGSVSDNSDEQPLPLLPSAGVGLEQTLENKLAEVKELFRARFGHEVDDPSEDEQSAEQEELFDEQGTLWIKTVGTGPLTIEVLEGTLAEVKELYRSVCGQDVDSETDNEDQEDCEYDSDGTMWLKTSGTGPLNVNVLQQRLAEVKELYQARFGVTINEDSESEDEEVACDEEGTPWIKTSGTGPLTVDVLEERLVEVKDLYNDAFGHDVDSEFDEDEFEYDVEGTAWVKTVGSGPLTLSVLEEKLLEVKALYKTKFGQGFDKESAGEEHDIEYDEEGTAWIKTVGTGLLTVDVLEKSLAEAKELYRSVFGHDLDAESEEEYEYDADGTAWVKAVGHGPLTVSALEDQLAEVKALFETKYGRDVDDESIDEARAVEYDEGGTPWIKTVGTGPLTVRVLEEKLAEVKHLYNNAFGRDVDSDSDEDDFEYDAEGTAWTKTVGSGPLTVSILEEHLQDVKAHYKVKYGRDFDDESAWEEQDFEYDQEGTAWIQTVGNGPLTVDALEKSLAEVKELYRCAFGHDLDAESEEEYEYDADGTAWVKTVGHGPLTVAALEDQLAEVKALFERRYGGDVDDEPFDDQDVEYDEEGTPWTKTTGAGPLTVDVLEESLAKVRSLYQDAFGRDVDSDSDEDFDYDAEGTAWIKTVGGGPLTLSILEENLQRVKTLYATKYGQDFYEESVGEEDFEYDEEGTPWIKTVGNGPLTVDALEKSLAEVKELYSRAFGSDMDSESEEEYEYDADGVAWVKTMGHGPLTVSALEDQLAEVKALFESMYGRDVDDESDEDQDLLEYDEEGALWIKTAGTGPLTLGKLEDKLSEVKELYKEMYGQDLDAESAAEAEMECEHDADGTLWVKTVGTGLLTVDVLEEHLEDVKELYWRRYGRYPDVDSEEEDDDLVCDADEALWVKMVGNGMLIKGA